MSIECDTEEHHAATAMATTALVIYPLGVFCLNALLLYLARNPIRSDTKTVSRRPSHSLSPPTLSQLTASPPSARHPSSPPTTALLSELVLSSADQPVADEPPARRQPSPRFDVHLRGTAPALPPIPPSHAAASPPGSRLIVDLTDEAREASREEEEEDDEAEAEEVSEQLSRGQLQPRIGY